MNYVPVKVSGGANGYNNPNGMPGEIVDYDSIIIGRGFARDDNGNKVSLFTPKNLFNVERDTIEFDYKCDPRWQPHDFLNITRLDNTVLNTRISTIEITHEGGGTMAHVVAKLLSAEELQD